MVQPGARRARRPIDLARAGLPGALSLLAITLAAASAPASAATVEVTVTGVRNDKGTVRVAICSAAEFLKPTCAHIGHAPAHQGEVVVQVPDVPPGTWAAQAFQDENDNHAIDKNLFGIPTEGIGFSNDARMMFGPPSFADAAFQLGPAGGRIHFSLRYF